MRSWIPLLTFVFVLGSFALPHLAQASIPFFGPIIPAGNNVCPAGWGMLMTVVNNIIEFLLTLAIVFVAPLMIAYAGFTYVAYSGNPGKRSEANKMLTNTIIGIVVALASWMIVDAVMAVLYNPSAAGGTWTSLINSNGEACLPQAGALPTDPLNPTKTTPGVSAGAGTGVLSSGTGACDASVVQKAAAAGGYTLTTAQSNVLACIAKPESSCGSNTKVAHKKDGTPTTATGAFQITFGAGTDNCHQLNLQVCTDAATAAVGWSGGNLNCSSVFTCSLSNPSACLPKSGKAANAAACTAAALNLNCNASAAACLVARNNGRFSDWTADPRSAIQTQCIDKNQ